MHIKPEPDVIVKKEEIEHLYSPQPDIKRERETSPAGIKRERETSPASIKREREMSAKKQKKREKRRRSKRARKQRMREERERLEALQQLTSQRVAPVGNPVVYMDSDGMDSDGMCDRMCDVCGTYKIPIRTQPAAFPSDEICDETCDVCSAYSYRIRCDDECDVCGALLSASPMAPTVPETIDPTTD